MSCFLTGALRGDIATVVVKMYYDGSDSWHYRTCRGAGLCVLFQKVYLDFLKRGVILGILGETIPKGAVISENILTLATF